LASRGEELGEDVLLGVGLGQVSQMSKASFDERLDEMRRQPSWIGDHVEIEDVERRRGIAEDSPASRRRRIPG